ncbi:WD40/YVTN/BNR-like repeat-containing protein [Fodinicola feengrottensis]|uniref:WD40/YVTN/BNR-like repeat-containing protein n=1 Tax=Fodinicola feengrottensis TaxID=435914 RepID=UPI0013D2B878|nr:hypothetical protein [Fodinicola feengrottensis]
MTTVALTTPASAAPPHPDPLRGVAKIQVQQHARSSGLRPLERGEGEGDALEVADQAEQYAGQRSAPGDSVSAAALVAARGQAAALPLARGRASEVTGQPLDAEPAGYTDPTWSNDGAGFRTVAGRTTALAVDGNTYYQGAADGGVWKSTDRGQTWHSIWDGQNTLSIGALLVGPDHSLWVGTGESNTSSDSYLGTGVYRSTNGGRSSFTRVGGDELLDHQTFRLVADGQGQVYAATNQGLYRHSLHTSNGGWTLVLKPDPNPTGSPYDTSFISDVAIRPGTGGQSVLAVLGWRNGTAYNGFYLSTTGGGPGSFQRVTPAGDIDATDIGRTTLAYAADGSRLYAIVQSPKKLLANDDTNLQGVFASASGNPAGPYTRIADSDSLGASGSALQNLAGYHVGIQSWYNQVLAVDPKNPDARLRQPGGGLPDQRRRQHIPDRQPILELRPDLRHRSVPAGHPPPPPSTRAGADRRPAGGDRQRRRHLSAPDVGDRIRQLGGSERHRTDAAILRRRRRAIRPRDGVLGRPAGQRHLGPFPR